MNQSSYLTCSQQAEPAIPNIKLVFSKVIGLGKIASILALLSLVIALPACSRSPEEQIIGRWSEESGMICYEFLPDGTFFGYPPSRSMEIKGTYTLLDGNRIELIPSVESPPSAIPIATYEFENDQLVITSEGKRIVFLRSGDARSSKSSSPSSSGTSSKSNSSTIKKEASLFAQELWENRWLQMGDSWFIKDNAEALLLYQVKGLYTELVTKRITQADTLNGIEWKGVVKYSADAGRYYRSKDHWQSLGPKFRQEGWYSWSETKGPVDEFVIQKVNGQWVSIENNSIIAAAVAGIGRTSAKPTRDEIPPSFRD